MKEKRLLLYLADERLRNIVLPHLKDEYFEYGSNERHLFIKMKELKGTPPLTYLWSFTPTQEEKEDQLLRPSNSIPILGVQIPPKRYQF